MYLKQLTLVLASVVALTVPVAATPKHHHTTHHRIHFDTYDRGAVIGGRPSGCPYAFCGCEASIYLFGHIKRDLNLASNWLRKFPHANPAPGMAAARNHHVMVLMSHVEGSLWLVHDGNSGHHLTREHVRSIAGYTVVDPHGNAALARAEVTQTYHAKAHRKLHRQQMAFAPVDRLSIH